LLTGTEGFDVPVALFGFNRPDLTRRVFDAIADVRPRRLFVIADGPRADRPGDEAACAEVRKIMTSVDWPCDVVTNFSPRNLGCGRRMSSGIDWLFNHVEAAVLLEDDCLPGPTFFEFCRAMLDRYANDSRIGVISGTNYITRWARLPGSYYFSRYTHVWGWASWRRSWAQYDFALTKLPAAHEAKVLETVLEHEALARFWYKIFDGVRSGAVDTWDYQLCFASFANSWLNIIPTANLVSNIGIGPHATHTKTTNGFENLPIEPLDFPLQHPEFITRCRINDELTERHAYGFVAPATGGRSLPASAIRGRGRRLVERLGWRGI
jgi:hypothetical protein